MIKTIVGDSVAVKGYTKFMTVDKCFGGNSNNIIKIIHKFDFPIALNCGLHDIKSVNGIRAVDENQYYENLKIIANHPSLFWITTTPVDDELHSKRKCKFDRFHKDVIRYNDIANNVMLDAGIKIIDLYEFTLSNLEEGSFRDGVHFTRNMVKKQAEWMTKILSSDLIT